MCVWHQDPKCHFPSVRIPTPMNSYSLLDTSLMMNRSTEKPSRFICIPLPSDPPRVENVNFVLSIHKIIFRPDIIEIVLYWRKHSVSISVISYGFWSTSAAHTLQNFNQGKYCTDLCSLAVGMWACSVGCPITMIHLTWALGTVHPVPLLKKKPTVAHLIQLPRHLWCREKQQEDKALGPWGVGEPHRVAERGTSSSFYWCTDEGAELRSCLRSFAGSTLGCVTMMP
jgi:hypothetical protein